MPRQTKRPERISNEVFVVRDPIVAVGAEETAFLRERVRETTRHRVRLCTHQSSEDRLQEMIILLSRETYVPPHKHQAKVESLHAIEGRADAVFFDDLGNITSVIPLGGYHSGHCYYYRIEVPCYHTLLLRSDSFLFHEATTGPFRRDETLFAPWAPASEDGPAIAAYLTDLDRAVRQFQARPAGEAP